MLMQLGFAFGLAAATVLVHALGSWEAVAYLNRVFRKNEGRQRLWIAELKLVRVVSLLLLLHLIEAAIWATSYWVSGVLPDFETAFYFSMTSYTTIGYGDVVLPVPRRLLGPIEGAVGILMLGWSTAIIVAAISRIQAQRTRVENRS
jgi:hypothetical protein